MFFVNDATKKNMNTNVLSTRCSYARSECYVTEWRAMIDGQPINVFGVVIVHSVMLTTSLYLLMMVSLNYMYIQVMLVS